MEYSPMVIPGTWKNYFDEVVGEFNASYVPGDSVWLRAIHQEISYATTQKLKNSKTQKTIATTSSNVPALTASTSQNIVTPESRKGLR